MMCIMPSQCAPKLTGSLLSSDVPGGTPFAFKRHCLRTAASTDRLQNDAGHSQRPSCAFPGLVSARVMKCTALLTVRQRG
eukprot:1538093-Amphidinium_carterae.1